jgi:hypothetical protein
MGIVCLVAEFAVWFNVLAWPIPCADPRSVVASMKTFPSEPIGLSAAPRDKSPLASFGQATGLLSGILTIPAMIGFLFVFSAVSSRPLGSMAVLALFVPGLLSLVLGGIVGGLVGGLIRRLGVRVDGPLVGACFGGCLMAIVGLFVTLADLAIGGDAFAEWLALYLGLDLASPIVAGIAGGALVGAITSAQERRSSLPAGGGANMRPTE